MRTPSHMCACRAPPGRPLEQQRSSVGDTAHELHYYGVYCTVAYCWCLVGIGWRKNIDGPELPVFNCKVLVGTNELFYAVVNCEWSPAWLPVPTFRFHPSRACGSHPQCCACPLQSPAGPSRCRLAQGRSFTFSSCSRLVRMPRDKIPGSLVYLAKPGTSWDSSRSALLLQLLW